MVRVSKQEDESVASGRLRKRVGGPILVGCITSAFEEGGTFANFKPVNHFVSSLEIKSLSKSPIFFLPFILMLPFFSWSFHLMSSLPRDLLGIQSTSIICFVVLVLYKNPHQLLAAVKEMPSAGPFALPARS